MRILIFSEPTWPRHPGGSGRCSFVYAAELVRRGHEVFLLCPGDPLRVELLGGVEIHRVPPTRVQPMKKRRTEENALANRYFQYACEAILPRGIDLMIDVGGFLSYFFSVTFAIRRLHHIPIIIYFHLLEDDPAKDPIHFIMRMGQMILFDSTGPKEHSQCFAVRSADAVICLTEEDAATVERLYRPTRLFVLPPPIDPHLTEANSSLSAPSFVPESSEHLIVFAGRVDDHNKGARIVRSAMRHILAVRSDVRLIVIGPACEKDFRDLGTQITCVGWTNDSSVLAGWLRSADVLLMPSRHESFGSMCAEALAVGLPVIASPLPALRKMVIHARNGYLLHGHNRRRWPKEIADLILGLLKDPVMLAQMKKNAVEGNGDLSAESLGSRLEMICTDTVVHASQVRRLEMPTLDAHSRSVYLKVLSEIGGRQARSAGESLLALLGQDTETRCQSCSRRGIASHIHQLAGQANRFGRQRQTRIRRTVFSTCPWSLAMQAEQWCMAVATGRVTFLQVWLSRAFYFVAKRLTR